MPVTGVTQEPGLRKLPGTFVPSFRSWTRSPMISETASFQARTHSDFIWLLGQGGNEVIFLVPVMEGLQACCAFRGFLHSDTLHSLCISTNESLQSHRQRALQASGDWEGTLCRRVWSSQRKEDREMKGEKYDLGTKLHPFPHRKSSRKKQMSLAKFQGKGASHPILSDRVMCTHWNQPLWLGD